MPTIQFIDVNPSVIIQETIAKYEVIAGYSLNPADVERITIDVMAYREQGILAKMETAMHQNFVQLASGFSLDYWGELFGVARNINEEDDDYRVRIINQNKYQPVGTRAFYISKIESLSYVSKARLISKQDDSSLPPGRVVICCIEEDTTGSAPKGISMSITNVLKTQPIIDVLNDWKVNLIGDMFSFQSAVPLPANGTIVVKKKIGVNATTFLAEVQTIIDNYFFGLSLNFDNEFANNDLSREILKSNNALSIQTNSFPNLPIKAYREYWVRGTINVSVV